MLEGARVSSVPREMVHYRLMEKFGWTYSQLLDTPKEMIDWILDIMDLEGQKSKFDQQDMERKVQSPRVPSMPSHIRRR